jgi:integrase
MATNPGRLQSILNWIDELERDKLAESTIHSYWLQLRTFLNFQEKIEVLSPKDNPVRFINKLELAPDEPDLPPVAFPPEDLDKIFGHLENLTRKNNREAVRNLALLRLAYVTGIRETGLAEMCLSQLDIEERCVLILANHNKSKKWQPVFFDAKVAAAVQAWLDIRPQRDNVQNVFVSTRGLGGAAMTTRGLYAILQRVCEAAGVARRKFHALRHSSALDALDAGISIDKMQRQMGHAHISTTMKYLRGRDKERARAYHEHSLSDWLAKRAV